MTGSDHVDNLLRAANRLALALAALRALALGAAGLALAFVAALLLDAMLWLSPAGLVALDLALAGVLTFALASLVWTLRRGKFERRRVARWVEERLGLRDNALINAVDLAAPPAGASPALAARALAEANDLAWKTSAADVVPSRPALVAVAGAFGAALAIATLFLAAPRLAAMVSTRLLDPHGDHPPYTLLDFETTVSPERLYSGRAFVIRVKISGPGLPQTARLVFVSDPADAKSGEETAAGEDVPLMMGKGEFFANLAPLDAPRSFYVDTPLGRSDVQRIVPLAIPTFESVQVEYEFPAYTGWPVGRAALTTRGIEALVGTKARVTVASNLPLEEGRLTILPKSTDPIDEKATGAASRVVTLIRSTSDERTVSGDFLVERDGRFELALIAASGAPSDQNPTGPIRAIPDGAPSVAITHPSPHTIAVEGSVVDVVVEARDDLAVERVSLSRSVNGWGPIAVDLPRASAAPSKFVRTQSRFDLGALGARPGDLITYFATAYDARPERQFRDTETHVIEVVSLEEYREFARQQVRVEELARKYAELQKRMEQLKAEREKLVDELARLRKKAKEEGLTEADQARLDDVEKRLEQYAEAAEQLARDVGAQADEPALYDAEESSRESLKRLQKRLEEQADAARQAGASAKKARRSPGDQRAFDLDAEAFERQEEPFADDAGGELASTQDALEKLSKVDEMLGQAQRIQQLVQQQRDLADRMAQFRAKDELSPEERARARQFAREQQRLQEELQDAADRLEKAAQESRELTPKTAGEAQRLAEAIREQGVPKDQQNAADRSRAGEGREAFESAEQAAQKLESLLGEGGPSADGAGQELAESLDPGLGLSAGRLQQSLKQMMQGRTPGPPGSGRPQNGRKNGPGNGLAGSRPRTTIVGPHMPTGRESDADESGASDQNDGRGQGVAATEAGIAGDAENLSPETRAAGAGPAGAMRGVPLGYRDQVDAYFKRLAEE